MATKVISAANHNDGLKVNVTLDSAAVGAITAKASREPGNPSAAAATVVLVSGNTYRVTVRSTAVQVRLPYYIQIFDGVTQLTSFQVDRTRQPAEETCVWVCLVDTTDWMDQTEQACTDILLDNLQSLNEGMSLYLLANELPSGRDLRVKRVHAGMPGHNGGAEYPQISVRTSFIQDDPYWANPRSDYLPFKTTITCYLYYEGKVNWEPLCRALGMAVFNVLNQDHYLENDLACGLRLYECYALTGTSSDDFDETANLYVTSFTLDWQAKLHVGRERL